jgi:tRNA (Thr-GGU) A37 N-methylase
MQATSLCAIERLTCEILQILGISLLDKTPINQLFNQTEYQNVNELNSNQMTIIFI